MRITPLVPLHASSSAAQPPAPAPPVPPVPAPPTTPPLFDFPGLAAGDLFDVKRGSKVGFANVSGEAAIKRLDPQAASFHLVVGAFGRKVDVTLDVERIDDTRVRVITREVGKPDASAVGVVVDRRQNFIAFEREDDRSQRTVLSHDGAGNVTIDSPVPGYGDAHLLLDKR